MLEKLKKITVKKMDDLFWKTKPEYVWWKGNLTKKERFIRMLKQFDKWALDLLFPIDDKGSPE